jgi:hypothetical protein
MFVISDPWIGPQAFRHTNCTLRKNVFINLKKGPIQGSICFKLVLRLLNEVQFSHKMKVSFHMNKTALKLTLLRWQVNRQICTVPCNQCFFLGEILPNLNLIKYMILTYTKDFSWKKMAQILQTFMISSRVLNILLLHVIAFYSTLHLRHKTNHFLLFWRKIAKR